MHILCIPFITMLLTLTTITVGCARREHREVPPGDLSAVADTYAVASASTWPDGWAETDHCDALLWAGLRAASGASVDVLAARAPDGQWFRRPTSLPECYASGESQSTVSRDMLLGVLWWAWSTGRGDVIGDLWSYAVDHAGVMGQGRAGGIDTVLTSNMWILLGKLCGRMGAHCTGGVPPAAAWAALPLAYPGEATGYVRHLETLQILLAGEADGGLSVDLVSRLALHRAEQPGNPLFAGALAVYGAEDSGAAAEIVFGQPGLWPSDHLPTSADRCATWATEQEFPGATLPEGAAALLPCPEEGRTHTGGEILFLRRILQGKR